MLFSVFTPLSLYTLSSNEPRAKQIYKSMVGALGDQFDMTVGESRMEAICFATSLAQARAEQCQRKGAKQGLIEHVSDMMPVREQEYRLAPAFDATMSDRRTELALRRKRPGTWTKQAIEGRLQELLGDDFVAYVPTPIDDAVRYPSAIGDSPMNLQAPTVPRKIVRLLDAVSFVGVSSTVEYEVVDSPKSPDSVAIETLEVGDKLVVEPEIVGIAESVTVTAVFEAPLRFAATFTKPHTDNCLGFTHPYPRWTSTKRHSLVVLTDTAAQDPEKRRIVNTWMRRMVRAASTWDVVGTSDGESTGAFLIGSSPLGAQTIGDVTL